MEKILSKEDIEDLLIGTTILGCGGGGDLANGKKLITKIYTKEKEFRLIPLEDLKEDTIVPIVGMVGGGISKEELKLVEGIKKTVKDTVLVAANELSKYIGVEFSGYMPSEIGPENTPLAMYVAAMKDKFILDGDTAGRAKPEITISTTNVANIPLTPLSIVSDFGDVMFVKKGLNQRCEDIIRFVSRASGGLCGVARCPMARDQLYKGIVQNSISLAIKIGKAARENEGDPVKEIINVMEGIKLFEGEISNFIREEKYGFVWGEIDITGTNKFEGERYKVWYKNENLISWRNEKVDATCPDIISIVDSKNGLGLSNWKEDFVKGKNVTVIGSKAPDIWRTKEGLEIFGPKHFGFEIEYVPIENIERK